MRCTSPLRILPNSIGGVLITNVTEIKSIESEAGVISTILRKPEFTFYSEQLRPNDFTDPQNAYIYYAVSELAKRGVTSVDAYNISNFLNAKESTKSATKNWSVSQLKEFIDLSESIARESVEDYMVLVNVVVDKALRRDIYNRLKSCERLCQSEDSSDLEHQIYTTLDDALLSRRMVKDIPIFKEKIDDYWREIQERQNGSLCGIPFKFPTLNRYASIEPSELFLFGAGPKEGKSMMLLNCAVDLLSKDLSVLYIDSELNSRMFTCRLISHLTRIEYNRVKSGSYTDEEGGRIQNAISWIKSKRFVHIYMPMFDSRNIYTTVKKLKHTMGLDVLIVDYFKGKGDDDAFATYQELGRFVDMVKNQICGAMDIAGLGAAQATATGKLADSSKIARNASTIAIIQSKSSDEIEQAGVECGNKKLRIVYNRNGEQMMPDEYIDLKFNGNLISYEECKQHEILTPY